MTVFEVLLLLTNLGWVLLAFGWRRAWYQQRKLTEQAVEIARKSLADQSALASAAKAYVAEVDEVLGLVKAA